MAEGSRNGVKPVNPGPLVSIQHRAGTQNVNTDSLSWSHDLCLAPRMCSKLGCSESGPRESTLYSVTISHNK